MRQTRLVIKLVVGIALIVMATILYRDEAQRPVATVVGIVGVFSIVLNGARLLMGTKKPS